MDKNDTINSSHTYVRLVLPLMSKHEVPITPENYAVWYKYVAGTDQKLSTKIQEMINNNISFSDDVNQTLYYEYCAESDTVILKTIRKKIQDILISVFGEIVGMNGQTEHYENVILNSVANLSQDSSTEGIIQIVGQIVNQTKEMVRYGKSLQEKLEHAKDDLESIKTQFEKVKTESMVDFLTGISNRKAFNEMLTKSINEAKRIKSTFGLLLIDIDHFKAFNDMHGHIIGDKVLKFVAQKTKELLKGKDFLARFGGEEFVVILPETDVTGAKAASKNIQKYFETAELKIAMTTEKLGTITVSIGVGTYQYGESAEELIKRADKALYFAKASGRNYVATEQDL